MSFSVWKFPVPSMRLHLLALSSLSRSCVFVVVSILGILAPRAFAGDVFAAVGSEKAGVFAKMIPPLIVLKVDDMRADGAGAVPVRWKRFSEFVIKHRVKAGVGIIADSLESPSSEYIDGLKRLRDSGFVEYWNHGYDHRRWTEKSDEGTETTVAEFRGSGGSHQRKHLELAQKLALRHLGEPFRAFGAPFNAIDTATATVLEDYPEITVWLYGPGPTSGMSRHTTKFVATRIGSVSLERTTSKTDFEWFVAGYEKLAPDRDYFVLQGHPNGWDDAAFSEFVKIIDYLRQRGTEFVFPSELPAALARRSGK